MARSEAEKSAQAAYMRRYRKRRWRDDPDYREKITEKNKVAQQERRARFQEYKQTLQCERCGFDDSRALVFHHKDPATKEINLAAKAAHWGWDRLQREIDKCEVLCANCHSIHHAEDR